MPGLTPTQRIRVDLIRAFHAAAEEGTAALAAHCGRDNDDYLHAYALGAARVHIGTLLAVIDRLTGGQP